MRAVILFVGLFCAASAQGQGRKLPNISFMEHSAAFANANRSYDENDQYTDTLHDERIVTYLSEILKANPLLSIEVGGHTALNEDTILGKQRAAAVTEMLVNLGVERERLQPVNFRHDVPIISDAIIFSLPTREERNAANQKNRRVEIKVISAGEEVSE